MIQCPVCSSGRNRPLFTTQPVYLCLSCGSNFRTEAAQKLYNRSYFEANHIEAYGKTYLEDEQNIRAFARRRLSVLKGLVPLRLGRKAHLMDVGSALGLFADEAAQAGFDATGCEIAPYARTIALERFGVKSHEDFLTVTDQQDCLTMWFTLEHIQNPGVWLDHAHQILSPRGILALGLPHAAGLLGRFNRPLYETLRPVEHWYEPTLGAMKKLLHTHGFTVEKVEFFGLHPQRANLPPWQIIREIQKTLGLGDTFEIYARKR